MASNKKYSKVLILIIIISQAFFFLGCDEQTQTIDSSDVQSSTSDTPLSDSTNSTSSSSESSYSDSSVTSNSNNSISGSSQVAVDSSEDGVTSPKNTTYSSSTGSSQESDIANKVTQAAQNVVAMGSRFPYKVDPNVGCANVVSVILNKAGLFNGMEFAVSGLMSRLEAAGWKRVSPSQEPQPGDVVVWKTHKTYGHIGVMTNNGYVANSSSRHKPMTYDPSTYPYPVTAILRKI